MSKDLRILNFENNGTPKAFICLLVAMMLLKESQDWSDEQLFVSCHCNLLVRSAINLLLLLFMFTKQFHA